MSFLITVRLLKHVYIGFETFNFVCQHRNVQSFSVYKNCLWYKTNIVHSCFTSLRVFAQAKTVFEMDYVDVCTEKRHLSVEQTKFYVLLCISDMWVFCWAYRRQYIPLESQAKTIPRREVCMQTCGLDLWIRCSRIQPILHSNSWSYKWIILRIDYDK